MKKFIMYGAGNIGRGFIGQLFSNSGYSVGFVDINKEVIGKDVVVIGAHLAHHVLGACVRCHAVLEHDALHRAFAFYPQLGMEGVVLVEKGKILAFAMGSRLNHDTFDIHFEKALDIDGAYAAINQGFASYLREKYPDVKWLNREDDMGIAGLRKAKLSYCPHHMVEKCWAELQEEDDDC